MAVLRIGDRGSRLVARHSDRGGRCLELGVEGRQGQSLPQREFEIGGVVFRQAMLAAKIDRVRPRLCLRRRVHQDRQPGEKAEPARRVGLRASSPALTDEQDVGDLQVSEPGYVHHDAREPGHDRVGVRILLVVEEPGERD
jgi:hypothetical protein